MQNNLITWYNRNKRDFPWRKRHDAYAIWISEIMLQQTTTEAVIPYYNRFLERFPTIKDLANASLEDVYKLWEGLGYYRRAKHLHETALIIMDKYQGNFPKTYDEILSLKGIGPYTAGAICSIAYHQSIPAIDGNVLRIISRLDLIKDNIALPQTQKKITKRVSELIQGYDGSDFNQGLMDLGATICRPVNPRCHDCPIQKSCQAYKHNEQNVLPINIKNIKHQDIHYITAVITYKDQFYMIQNPAGLLENLYGFVQYECESPYTFIEKFKDEYKHDLIIASYITDIKHVFTHRIWRMHVYHFTLDKPLLNMYSLDDIAQIPVSTAHQKVLKAYMNKETTK